ncbi:hypothetical protein PBRA_005637 [Plasmodiophora brassicae]|uniref:Uncharacterized protein n=1 Tax=Plasmodiophora brassicae TaxID=37360 RepID=A0A0G4IPD7_PLABS|nr:hypothetical protein PBRA_005637 [Plasmodiophora brassicae]
MSTLSTWKPSSRPAHMALRPGSHRVAFDAGLYKSLWQKNSNRFNTALTQQGFRPPTFAVIQHLYYRGSTVIDLRLDRHIANSSSSITLPQYLWVYVLVVKLPALFNTFFDFIVVLSRAIVVASMLYMQAAEPAQHAV